MTTAVAIIVDASVVTAVALLACRVLRQRPAALRHMVLASALAAVAAIPLLEIAVPHWDVPVLASAPELTTSGLTLNSDLAVPSTVDAGETLDAPGLTLGVTLLVVWSLGFMAVTAGLCVGLVRLLVTTRRCQPVQSTAWRERATVLSREYGLTRSVTVLESPDRSLLLTWGLFRPRIIVPASARSWTAGRIDVVLAHELAHIVRRDWVLQIAAEVVRAVHWFNPLVWLASRQLRDESEQACDDAVLRRGLTAVDYASHLLAVARHVAAGGRRWASAPAVADPSTLERRISAMLHVSRNHTVLTRTRGVCTVLVALALTVPLTAVTLTERLEFAAGVTSELPDIQLAPPPAAQPVPVPAAPRPRRTRLAPAAAAAQQNPASVSGTLNDASGAVLPGVQVTLTDASGMTATTFSSAVGTFTFQNVVPASYRLAARLPGFASVAIDLSLASGENLQRRIEMRVGGLNETVTVTCPVGTATVPTGAPVLAFGSRRVAPPLFVTTSARGPAFAAMAQAAQVQPVRVGGQIAAPRQIKKVAPVCPGGLPANGYVVILESTIGVDGLVKDIKVLRPKPGEQQDLVQPAIDALRQWEFTPTRLNNVPIPVIMTVTVNYTRQ